jgi:Prokaryotic membrane lipoprotein lipid attachment site
VKKSLSILGLALLLTGCSKPSAAPAPAGPAAADAPPVSAQPAAKPDFVNRVWSVASSSAVAPGTLYVFLSEGTLVIASPQSKPMLGSWKRSGDGLIMVEESIEYPTDILKLDAGSFVIRSHNPGPPVDISLVPADMDSER